MMNEQQAVRFLEMHGYRRCDIAACNCGSWHGGHASQRLTEVREALEEAGFSTQGETILSALQKALRRLTGERGTLRILLQEADGVLSTIEPDDTHEAELLEQLRRDIAKALGECPQS